MSKSQQIPDAYILYRRDMIKKFEDQTPQTLKLISDNWHQESEEKMPNQESIDRSSQEFQAPISFLFEGNHKIYEVEKSVRYL
ncbi:1868_t:CDS:2 [Acaulospora morrowiae]|uniref:1868_t:CDS:1 n=1 Tax=Acaulospora morrowiae TaxID=94023 RepID=A0A9N8YN21_9GLOM|nr:1868_t:CDS:2 [Acaulospora morrowiae]